MNRRTAIALALSPALPALAAPKPKLVLAIMVDQFRYDYLVRFRSEYKGGLDRLLTRGAVFTNAQYEHFPTVTAIGHSTFLSGATPSISGIIGNDWFDRASGKTVTSVEDSRVRQLGGSGNKGASPHRLLVSTVGDELKIATESKARVIGISLKDRSAILPVGHMADGAFWLDSRTGQFVSSTFYFPDLPAWVKDFNGGKPADQYLGAKWDLKPYANTVHELSTTADEKFYNSLAPTPYGNELIEALAERAIVSERLGRGPATDLLALSFSSNDYVGHDKGPDSPEVHSISVHTDRLLDKLFHYVDAQVGMQNVLVVLSADHGVAPLPEVTASRRMPGGRMPAKIIQDTVKTKLSEKFGEGQWILSPSDHSLYLNRPLIQQKVLDEREVQRVAAEAAASVPHVARVYTRSRLASSTQMEDAVGRRVLNGYHDGRGADLMIVLDPYWMYSSKGTTHGSPYAYDTHVPLILMGPGVKPGGYSNGVAVNDIAPTVARLVEADLPSGSVGRVLTEALAPGPLPSTSKSNGR
ncbi:MAG: alkaline phosphatase family protein [Bryobacteraceae bacterium]